MGRGGRTSAANSNDGLDLEKPIAAEVCLLPVSELQILMQGDAMRAQRKVTRTVIGRRSTLEGATGGAALVVEASKLEAAWQLEPPFTCFRQASEQGYWGQGEAPA